MMMSIKSVMIYTILALVVTCAILAAAYYFLSDDGVQIAKQSRFEPPELSDNPPMNGEGIDQIYKDMEPKQ